MGSTLAFVTDLPDDQECQKVQYEGETLYECNGVLYRSTYHDDQQVYEIVSDPEGEAASEPTSVVGLSLTDPLTRGEVVRDLQNRLVGAGYDVGGVDGVFGSGTDNALQWFQYDNEMDPTGVVDVQTAELLGFRPENVPPASTDQPATTEPEQSDQ